MVSSWGTLSLTLTGRQSSIHILKVYDGDGMVLELKQSCRISALKYLLINGERVPRVRVRCRPVSLVFKNASWGWSDSLVAWQRWSLFGPLGQETD